MKEFRRALGNAQVMAAEDENGLRNDEIVTELVVIPNAPDGFGYGVGGFQVIKFSGYQVIKLSAYRAIPRR